MLPVSPTVLSPTCLQVLCVCVCVHIHMYIDIGKIKVCFGFIGLFLDVFQSYSKDMVFW